MEISLLLTAGSFEGRPVDTVVGSSAAQSRSESQQNRTALSRRAGPHRFGLGVCDEKDLLARLISVSKRLENKNPLVMRMNHGRTNEVLVIQRCKKKKKCLLEGGPAGILEAPRSDRQTDRVTDSQTGTLTNGPWEET